MGMKASEMIEKLQKLIDEVGDSELLYSTSNYDESEWEINNIEKGDCGYFIISD